MQTKTKNHISRSRITVQLPNHLIDAIRDAAYWLSGPPHQLTLTAFAEMAFARELERVHSEHNSGKPFRKRSGPLRAGRPLGSGSRPVADSDD